MCPIDRVAHPKRGDTSTTALYAASFVADFDIPPGSGLESQGSCSRAHLTGHW